MSSMKLTAENGKKNVTLQGHKFSDLPTALETNKQRWKVLETSPRRTLSLSLETENPFYWDLGNEEKPTNSNNNLCFTLRLIEGYEDYKMGIAKLVRQPCKRWSGSRTFFKKF